jgi:hypothetical protein
MFTAVNVDIESLLQGIEEQNTYFARCKFRQMCALCLSMPCSGFIALSPLYTYTASTQAYQPIFLESDCLQGKNSMKQDTHICITAYNLD